MLSTWFDTCAGRGANEFHLIVLQLASAVGVGRPRLRMIGITTVGGSVYGDGAHTQDLVSAVGTVFALGLRSQVSVQLVAWQTRAPEML